MALFINQGKQTIQEQPERKIFVVDNAKMEIIKLAINQMDNKTFDATLRFIDGENKGLCVMDTKIPFTADSKYAWKYQNFRKAAGHPYSESESENIDIEKLLLHCIVTVDLSEREYQSKTDGKMKKAQKIKYHIPEAVKEQEMAETINEDDLPFKKAESDKGMTQTAGTSPKSAVVVDEDEW